VVYLNSLGGGFVWDDRYLIVENPRLRTWSGLVESWTNDYVFTAETNQSYGYYRPVAALSLWLDYRIWGPDPFGFHLTNVLLHALCAGLVVLACRRLGLAPTASALAGVLFAVHPLHVENVAWISGRTDVLAFLFGIVSLLAHFAAKRDLARRPFGWHVLSLASFAAALLAKEMAAVVPLWIAAVELVRSPREVRGALRAAAGHALVLVAYLVVRFAVLGIDGPEVPPSHGLGLALATAPWTILRYLAWLALPLAPAAYVQNPYVTSAADPRLWGAAAALALAGWALWRAGRRRREVRICALLLGLSFAPVLNLQRIAGPEDMGSPMAERFCYFPSFPFLALAGIAAAAGFAATTRRPLARTALTLAVAAIVAAAAVRTWTRTPDWRDDRTLFERETRRTPTAPLLWTQLSHVALYEGRLDEADRHLARAEALAPEAVGVRALRAQWLVFAGRLAEALAIQQRVAATLGARNHAARNNLAFLYRATGSPERARPLLESLVASVPSYADPHFNLGAVRRAEGDLERAAAELRRYRELRPEDPRGLDALAEVEADRGRREAVEALYRDELARRAPNARTWNALAALRHRLGDSEGAREALERALEVDPRHGPSRFNLALILDEGGRRTEAIAHLERLRREAPGTEAGRAAAARLETWAAEGSADDPGRARMPRP
jgi:tetratricopeptide (TPR) repeat protein